VKHYCGLGGMKPILVELGCGGRGLYMPKWRVHEALAELCGIPRALMRELNEFIDSTGDPRFHDVNRVIIEGRWDPEALAYADYVVLERWGYEGLKAFLCHHMLDYAEQLALSRRVHETHMGSYVVSWVKGLVNKVLDGIIRDFEVLLRLALKKSLGGRGGSNRNVIEDIEKLWGVKLEHPEDLVRLIEGGGALNLSAAIVEAVRDIRECLNESVYELVVFYLGFPKDSCVICKAFVSPSERYIIYEDLEYRVHERCLTWLRSRVDTVISRANIHARKEIYRFIVREWALPATIAYKVVHTEPTKNSNAF